MSLYLRDYKELYEEIVKRIEIRRDVLTASLNYLDDNERLTEDEKKGIIVAVDSVTKAINEDLTDMKTLENALSRKNKERRKTYDRRRRTA